MPRIIIQDELTDTELDFLLKKYERETKNFYRVLSIFMIICFVIPFVVAWVRAFGGDGSKAFSYFQYFLGVGYLMSFLAICAWVTYRRTLHKIKQDITQCSKTIERSRITRKQHIQHNNEYYFYLDSPNKLSIEVTEPDFYMLKEGDEINIEYSTNAKLYFGYF